MAQVVTMCDFCRQEQSFHFRIKPITGKTTTEKKKKCEFCKKPYPSDFLKQYVVSGKGGKG